MNAEFYEVDPVIRSTHTGLQCIHNAQFKPTRKLAYCSLVNS